VQHRTAVAGHWSGSPLGPCTAALAAVRGSEPVSGFNKNLTHPSPLHRLTPYPQGGDGLVCLWSPHLALTRTQQILRDRLYAELTPVVAALGLDLVEVELTPVGHDQRVGLIVDRPEGHGPVKIDDCARSSRAVSAYLDTVNPFENEYDLEVSSPGTDRKLRDLVDVARFVGNTAKIQVTGDSSRLDDGAKEALQGVLVAVETTADGQAGVRVRVGKKASSERLLAWSDVVVARLALTPDEWDALGRKLMAEQAARAAAGLDTSATAQPEQAEDDPDDDLDDDDELEDDELDDDELGEEPDETSAR